jgi:hypothetical protein
MSAVMLLVTSAEYESSVAHGQHCPFPDIDHVTLKIGSHWTWLLSLHFWWNARFCRCVEKNWRNGRRGRVAGPKGINVTCLSDICWYIMCRSLYSQKEIFVMALRRCQVISSAAPRRVYNGQTTSTSRYVTVVRSVTLVSVITRHSRWSGISALCCVVHIDGIRHCLSCKEKHCLNTYIGLNYIAHYTVEPLITDTLINGHLQ